MEGKTHQHTSVTERTGRLTPHIFAFERLGHKDGRESSKEVDKYATISTTMYFISWEPN